MNIESSDYYRPSGFRERLSEASSGRIRLEGGNYKANSGASLAQEMATSRNFRAGVSAGTISAVVAGVGLVAAGIYFVAHKNEESQTWKSRIEAERQRSAQIAQGL